MSRWTPESRTKQAAVIRRRTPWTLSTGPPTEAGKARSSRNAWKSGVRAKVSNWHGVLRWMALSAENLISLIRLKRCFYQAVARAVPKASTSPWAVFDAGEDDDPVHDIVNGMCSAEMKAALQQVQGWRSGPLAA